MEMRPERKTEEAQSSKPPSGSSPNFLSQSAESGIESTVMVARSRISHVLGLQQTETRAMIFGEARQTDCGILHRYMATADLCCCYGERLRARCLKQNQTHASILGQAIQIERKM